MNVFGQSLVTVSFKIQIHRILNVNNLADDCIKVFGVSWNDAIDTLFSNSFLSVNRTMDLYLQNQCKHSGAF